MRLIPIPVYILNFCLCSVVGSGSSVYTWVRKVHHFVFNVWVLCSPCPKRGVSSEQKRWNVGHLSILFPPCCGGIFQDLIYEFFLHLWRKCLHVGDNKAPLTTPINWGQCPKFDFTFVVGLLEFLNKWRENKTLLQQGFTPLKRYKLSLCGDWWRFWFLIHTVKVVVEKSQQLLRAIKWWFLPLAPNLRSHLVWLNCPQRLFHTSTA